MPTHDAAVDAEASWRIDAGVARRGATRCACRGRPRREPTGTTPGARPAPVSPWKTVPYDFAAEELVVAASARTARPGWQGRASCRRRAVPADALAGLPGRVAAVWSAKLGCSGQMPVSMTHDHVLAGQVLVGPQSTIGIVQAEEGRAVLGGLLVEPIGLDGDDPGRARELGCLRPREHGGEPVVGVGVAVEVAALRRADPREDLVMALRQVGDIALDLGAGRIQLGPPWPGPKPAA